ncbi:DNA-binding domain-containing protein [Polaromonas sp. YR568]|uniref:DNA-binding domain-containing protein n=1 Tax=Polaromonas sp. YR568 TaxID=1855301 RepID=UPI003137D4B0
MSALSQLAHDQQQLLRALVGDRDEHALWPRLKTGGGHAALARRGLLAYQTNGLALAERALGAAYPVLAQLLGDDNFAALARHFWLSAPPVRGDLAQWGGELPAFVEAAPQLAEEAFLGDVARVEWALHRAASAADVVPEPSSFAWLASMDPSDISLQLAAGVWLLDSPYPVASLVNAHRETAPGLATAAERLQAGVSEQALVWRQGFKPRVAVVTAAEAALLQALQQGASLDAALGLALAQATEFDFSDWLGRAVPLGLVTGVVRLSCAPADLT